jgi:hypothetical protein
VASVHCQLLGGEGAFRCPSVCPSLHCNTSPPPPYPCLRMLAHARVHCQDCARDDEVKAASWSCVGPKCDKLPVCDIHALLHKERGHVLTVRGQAFVCAWLQTCFSRARSASPSCVVGLWGVCASVALCTPTFRGTSSSSRWAACG